MLQIIYYTFSLVLQPGSHPPPPRPGNVPNNPQLPPDELPIDGELWILMILACVVAAYFFYKKYTQSINRVS